MKTLRPFILVLLLSVASLVFTTAQGLAQQPEVQMQSTSVLQGSGSMLPQAAMTGVVTTSEQAYTPKGRIRKVGESDGFEDEEGPDKPGEPFPIGDAGWPLMLLAIGYAIYSFARKRRWMSVLDGICDL